MNTITKPQKIGVFQQNGSAEQKIVGLKQFGGDNLTLEIHSVDIELPTIIENSEEFLPASLSVDLALNFLSHPDLSHDLVSLCSKLKIPIISSGKKISHDWGLTPPTCCGLPKYDNLGFYGDNFGAPEFVVQVDDGKISQIEIIRGASCGATWSAAEKIIGLSIEDAKVRIGLETQFFCYADGANWDPINGKSPLHFAGKVHTAGLSKAIDKALSK